MQAIPRVQPRSMTVYSSASGQGIKGVLPIGDEVTIGTPILGQSPILYDDGTRAGYINLAETEPGTAKGNTPPNRPARRRLVVRGRLLLLERRRMEDAGERAWYYYLQPNRHGIMPQNISTPNGYWVDELGQRAA